MSIDRRDELIDRALAEDVGDGDATTAATVPADARARATITQKAPGVISGLTVAEAVAVDAAVGRVSAESIAGYPPGIPALLPGERITAEAIDYLRELRTSGARLHGASDPEFRTIVVLCDVS